jgi:nucleoside-diphosphate-sugar epimerase
VAADLGEPATWSELGELVPAFDAVVHAAACLDHAPGAEGVALVNCAGTQALAAVAAERGAALVHISGVPVIGLPRVLPVDEEHPTAPHTVYHASKLFAEHVTAVAGARGIPAVSLRLTSPVGPGLPGGRILSVFAQSAQRGEALHVAGRGTRRQDYVDVRDVAAAVHAALQRQAGGVINVAAGVAVSNAELARRCVELAGSEAPVLFGERPDPLDDVAWQVSIRRAADVLGWRPERSIDDAIAAAMG